MKEIEIIKENEIGKSKIENIIKIRKIRKN